MSVAGVPLWIQEINYPYVKYDDIPKEIFDGINRDLDKKISPLPEVSVIVSAYNEEVNILRCIASLSRTSTALPFEIIVTNNNSNDQTQRTLDNLHVKSIFQPIQGWGPARQMGQEHARGKYVLMADADCFYPPGWIDEMINVLSRTGVSCVYGRYSFIPEPGFPRWKLKMLETMKNVIAEYRHYKRPYLNAYGISMGYIREFGIKIGFIMKMVRGEDGRMAFDLMNYGRIMQVKSKEAVVWTGPRTLQRDGSFSKALWNRVTKEWRRFFTLLKPEKPHDTKNSSID
ncbi:glycosyltransferase family 2 protein [Pedobacter deserti]|uniref:glycosyltransferase family 2 protein n=1 Tax=Pedobacter deserti TaxID=2817382 RepID=UPI00210CF566|nr:glycosyltransferase family 2 protein [Pedobacter sp. SYSU D00382]